MTCLRCDFSWQPLSASVTGRHSSDTLSGFQQMCFLHLSKQTVHLQRLKHKPSLMLQLGYNLHKFFVVGRKKPSVIEKSLLHSPALVCLSEDKAFVSPEERLKLSTTNRKNRCRPSLWASHIFSQGMEDNRLGLNLCCIPSLKQSRLSILR